MRSWAAFRRLSELTSRCRVGFHAPSIIRPLAHFTLSNTARLPSVKHPIFTLQKITLHHPASHFYKWRIPEAWNRTLDKHGPQERRPFVEVERRENKQQVRVPFTEQLSRGRVLCDCSGFMTLLKCLQRSRWLILQISLSTICLYKEAFSSIIRKWRRETKEKHQSPK